MKIFSGAAAIACLASLTGISAGYAAGDICEGKAGPELVRCIESAARTGAPSAGTAPQAAPSPRPKAPAARPTAEDCTGRVGEKLRACLAAGGFLRPEAAVVPKELPVKPEAPSPAAGGCEGKSGAEALRCIEATAKATAARPSEPQVLNCTRYHKADQPLCLHRNTALIECRNRQRYPDPDRCVRSVMATAPQPERADCASGGATARAQCEARNRVYAGCRADRMAYFDCLEHKLGPDAYARR